MAFLFPRTTDRNCGLCASFLASELWHAKRALARVAVWIALLALAAARSLTR
jgi:hypothetical protein